MLRRGRPPNSSIVRPPEKSASAFFCVLRSDHKTYSWNYLDLSNNDYDYNANLNFSFFILNPNSEYQFILRSKFIICSPQAPEIAFYRLYFCLQWRRNLGSIWGLFCRSIRWALFYWSIRWTPFFCLICWASLRWAILS